MKNKNLIHQALKIGKIGSTYGIHGWLKIIPYTERKENIFFYYPWYIKNKKNEFSLFRYGVEDWKFLFNKKMIFKLKNISNKEEAKKFTNLEIIIDRIQLPELKNEEYYLEDILKCKVFDTYGTYIGKVTKIIHSKIYDILVIKNFYIKKSNIKFQLVPFVQNKIIKEVNLFKKSIIVGLDTNY